MNREEKELTFNSLFVPFTTKKAVVFIIIISFVVFFNGLFNNFVRDDVSQIVENQTIKSIWNIPSIFFENRLTAGNKTFLGGAYYKPILDSSLTVINAVSGIKPFPFHLFQMVLYIVNACLLFILFKQFFRKEISFILALIFLIHPINSETVFYISDIQEVLFIFFGLLSLLILVKSKSAKSVILACLFLFISLLSKETGILFYGLSALYVFLYARKKLYLLLGSSVVSIFIYILLRAHALSGIVHSSVNFPFGRLDLITRLLNIPEIFLFYLKTTFFPFQLSSSYNWFYSKISYSHFFLPLIIDLIFLGFIVSIAILIYKKFPRKILTIYLFFMTWFFLGVAFHLQIIPLDQTVAERWFYFPLIGVLGMSGVVVEKVKVNFKSRWVILGLSLLIVLLAIKIFSRSLDFKNDFTLTNRDIQIASKTSNSDFNLEYLISYMYYSQNHLQEAKAHAEKSVQYFPTLTNYTNLGAIDSSMGDYAKAKEAYLRALKYGEDSLPYENLSYLFLVYGDPLQNIAFIKNIALRKYPADGALWFNLSILEYKQEDISDAKKDIKKAELYSSNNHNVSFVNYIIGNNKPLNLKVEGGNVSFYTF